MSGLCCAWPHHFHRRTQTVYWQQTISKTSKCIQAGQLVCYVFAATLEGRTHSPTPTAGDQRNMCSVVRGHAPPDCVQPARRISQTCTVSTCVLGRRDMSFGNETTFAFQWVDIVFWPGVNRPRAGACCTSTPASNHSRGLTRERLLAGVLAQRRSHESAVNRQPGYRGSNHSTSWRFALSLFPNGLTRLALTLLRH